MSLPLVSQRALAGLRGVLAANDPTAAMGDKSISHRALMLAGIAHGRTRISGLLVSEDTERTHHALTAAGVTIHTDGTDYVIDGVGLPALRQPRTMLNMGNSGTSARLLIGLLGGTGHEIKMTGDASLIKRPMKRVITPLSQMGIGFTARDDNFLPLTLRGQRPLLPIDYTLPVASAQVKSAILLAGLSAMGKTTVREKNISRDHSERMLAHFGYEVEETMADGLRAVSIIGNGGGNNGRALRAKDIAVPRDISSVAFLLVAASLVDGSDITIANVGVNPTRDGVIETLLEMGADISVDYDAMTVKGGEPTATIRVRHATLKGTTTPAARAPRMIDEYPIVAMAAACAHGTSVFHGLDELTVKESNRLTAIAQGLQQAGVAAVKTGSNWLEISGQKTIKGGTTIAANLDHRIAMSFFVLGLVSRDPITIDDASSINTSFPQFLPLLKKLGAIMA